MNEKTPRGIIKTFLHKQAFLSATMEYSYLPKFKCNDRDRNSAEYEIETISLIEYSSRTNLKCNVNGEINSAWS